MGFTKDIIGTNESVGGINLFEKVQSTQPATPYTAGLMSATDKSKLDSLENYVHPDSGVVPGKYMQVDVNEQGHVVAGRELQNSTLEDYRIKDAYIDLSDNSIVLGSHRLKPITPSDKVRWEQIVDTPNTLKEFGVTDVALSDGTINIGGDLITPLTADSQLSADKITGVIDLKNIPVGAMERCVVVEDDTARFALTTNDVQKGDTVKVINPTPTMYMVVDENKLDSADGYVIYSAGNANSVPWSGITDKPDHYYELPPADINTLGGVIVGDNITVDTDGKISTHPPYVLPQATNSTLGGVKIGENILEQPDGTINISTATTNAPGVVKIGDNINIDDDGTISTEKYQLPTATNMRLGGVRIGKYLSVDSEGLLNATGVPITASKTDMGGVIIGENIDVDKNGKISVTLPTKTSELENDSEFITTENLSLHNNDENAHASKFEAMHGQLVNAYNNVVEMKQSTRLKAGMAAKTLGYYSTNDGGGAYYVIREKQDSDVDDGGSIHELASGLVAELIVENSTISPEVFGAKGDGITDDSQAIQKSISICNLNFTNSRKYKISQTISIPSSRTINFNSCEIIADCVGYPLFSLGNSTNEVNNVCINGNQAIITGSTSAIFKLTGHVNSDASLDYTRKIEITGIHASGNEIEYSIVMETAVRDIYINNCLMYTKNGVLADGKTVEIMLSKCVIFTSGKGEFKSLEIKSQLGGSLYNEGWTISDCTIDCTDKTNGYAIVLSDIYVFELINSYIGSKVKINSPSTTTHTRDIVINNNVFNNNIFINDGQANKFNLIFSSNEIIAHTLNIGNNSYNITISNCRFTDTSTNYAIVINDDSYNISCNNIDVDNYAGGIAINGATGGNNSINGLNYLGSGQPVFLERPVYMSNIISADNTGIKYVKCSIGTISVGDDITSMNVLFARRQKGFIVGRIKYSNGSSSQKLIINVPSGMNIPSDDGWSARYIYSSNGEITLNIPFWCSKNVNGTLSLSNIAGNSINMDYHCWLGYSIL